MDELYPQSFIDGLPDPEPWENPWLIGILRFEHNAPFKTSLEKWYTELPTKIQPRFTKRLRSTEDSEFVSAVYELIIHQYCKEEGWTIEYEPDIGGGLTPDFVITTQTGEQFIIEVATLFEAKDIADGLRIQREINKGVSKLESQYGLTIGHRAMPIKGANIQRAVKEVAEWLKSMKGDGKRQRKTFKSHGFDFEVDSDPRFSPGENGSVVAITSGGSVPNYSDRIRSILKSKNTKYGSKKTKLPLVVVMAGGGEMIHTDFHSVDRALYGEMVVRFPINGDGESEAGRDESGLFTPKREKGSVVYRNTGISAVTYMRLTGEYEDSMNKVQMLMMYHLNPNMKLPSSIFEKLPQYDVVNKDEQRVTMGWSVDEYENQRIGFKY